VCLSIGFGIAANDASALEWLQRSGRSQIELDQQLARMAQWSQASEPWLYHTTYLNNLSNNGYLHNIDYFGIYTSDYPWATIKESYQREITDLSARLGPQSILPLFLRLVYALLLRNAGHYEEASSIQEHSLRHLQSNPGIANYLDTQALMSELAETHRRQGNFDQAMRYCEEVIAERNRVFGLGHPQLLACLHLKARLLQQKGSDQEAETMYKTLINQCQSTLGKYHVDTLNVMSDLGSLYLVQTRYDEALSLVDEELQLTEHLFGPYHYSTLTSLNNLGAVHFEMGDPSRAQGLLDLVLFRLRLTLSPEHPSTCTVLANCGSLYRKLEKYKESLSCYDEALINVEHLLGRGHPRALEVVLAKAMLLVEAQGDFDEIDGLFQRCVQGREKAFDENHPEVLEVLQYYSLFLTQREKFDQAEKSYRLLLLRQESSLGVHNEGLVPTLSNLGEVLSQLAREDAGDMYRRAFRLASELDGEEELTWTCMRNLARYLHEFGSDMEEVEKLYRLVVDSQRANSWEQGLDNGEDLDSLTQVLFEQGKFQEAEAIQRELIILTQALPDQDHVDWIEKIATLALILSRQGKFSEAERYYLEAFNMSAEAAGEDEVRTLDLSRELAWTMERGGKSEQARLRALEALQKSKARYGMLHPLHLRVKAVAAAIHFRQGDRAAAIDLNDEVVRGSLRVFGAESEEVQAAEANQAIYAKQ
jgi:tetratricopeptide (TPR) repeat protein